VNAAPLTASSEKTVLFVKETVTASGTANVSAQTGPLTTSERGFGIERLGTRATTGTTPAGLPSIKFGGSYATPTGRPTKGVALDMANASIQANFPYLQQSLSSYLKKNGVTSGWFNFKQEVGLDVNGKLETWTVYWDYFFDQNGRGGFADATLVSPDPKALYVVYTSQAVDSSMPAGWAYPGGGTLKYQLRDMQFQPVTDWVTLDVGGIYDSAQTEVENQDGSVACLMDNANAGCPAGVTDVKRLLDSTGAVLSVVDYVRRVEPVWIDQPDGSQVPKMSAAVTLRELLYSGCDDPVYHNSGQLGYELSQTVSRFLATASGSPRRVQYQTVQQYTGTYLSPTTSYDYSKTVPRSMTTGLGSYAIDPVKGETLMLTSEIPGLVSLAGVTLVGSPTKVIGSVTGAYWQYGGRDDAYQVTWSLQCATGGDGYEISTKIEATRHWNGWHASAELKSPVSDVSWSPVALDQFGPNRYYAYADKASRIVRLTEGVQSASYAYAASGGLEGRQRDFVCSHNNWSMQQQGAGYNFKCYSFNLQEWRCGVSAHTYNLYYDTRFMGTYSTQECQGANYLRGFNMDTGAPVWELIIDSQFDRSQNAVYRCNDWGSTCEWAVEEYSPNWGGS
jgi:hypothetical protein